MDTNNTLILKIDRLATTGEGISKLPDGRTVFIPFTLPGEEVKCRVVQQKKTYARAELIEIVQAASNRITPRCKHFGICGGCQLQHLDYADQLTVKKKILSDLLVRTAKLYPAPEIAVVPSPNPWNYRNHIQLHLAEDGRLGYQMAQSNRVVPIEECWLPMPALDQAWKQVSFDAGLQFDRISLRQSDEEEITMLIDGGLDSLPEMDIDTGFSIIHRSEENRLVIAGSPISVISIHGRQFQVSAESFFQVNNDIANELVSRLLAEISAESVSEILDIYAGVGLFSAFAAQHTRHLVSVESSTCACEDFAANLDEFDHADLYQGNAEDVLPALDLHPQVVIVDPPRAGLDRVVIDALMDIHPGKIIYISCDPGTFARDTLLITGNDYRLTSVTLLDMFPQTIHFETMGIFEAVI